MMLVRRVELACPARLRDLMIWGCIASLVCVLGANGARADGAGSGLQQASSAFGYGIVIMVAVATFVAFGLLRAALINSSNWSLADALSEEADISAVDDKGAPLLGPDQKPQMMSALRASTSRFIAMFGLISILLLYFGFGLVVLKGYAVEGVFPKDDELQRISNFLLTGLTLFAPYVINKFSSAFDWLTPKK